MVSLTDSGLHDQLSDKNISLFVTHGVSTCRLIVDQSTSVAGRSSDILTHYNNDVSHVVSDVMISRNEKLKKID